MKVEHVWQLPGTGLHLHCVTGHGWVDFPMGPVHPQKVARLKFS